MPFVRLESKKNNKMKNLETIINVGEDRANCIKTDNPNEIAVISEELV